MPSGYKPFNPITSINGYAVEPGMYASALMVSEEQERQYFSERWTTLEQRLGNELRRTLTNVCPSCDGWGSLRDHKAGCKTCLGTGRVPKEEYAHGS